MKGRICLCPASIAWIIRNLKKSSKSKFRTMIRASGQVKTLMKKGRTKKFSAKGRKRLRAGVHWVKIRGKSRKVRVLANGKWRFMKGKRR